MTIEDAQAIIGQKRRWDMAWKGKPPFASKVVTVLSVDGISLVNANGYTLGLNSVLCEFGQGEKVRFKEQEFFAMPIMEQDQERAV